VLLPVLVCQDGFTITHSAEPVELLPDDAVRGFVGEYRVPHAVLDAAQPVTQGPFAMPDYYYELRRQQTAAIEASAEVFEELAAELAALTGRSYGALEPYRLDGASRALVVLGSTAGTIKDAVDELRDEGQAVGLVRVTSFRPFPAARLADELRDVEIVTVLDRADSPGGAPPLRAEVAAALYGGRCELQGAVYGLGGRDLHPADVRAVFEEGPPPHVGLRSVACPV
jgi:pyruvate ferredoxin oxidoreductase alpha subunit